MKLALAAVVAAAVLQTGAVARAVAFVNPPRLVSEQDAFTLYVRVPHNTANRALSVAALDGTLVVSYDERPLDGERAPAMSNFDVRLPAGDLLLVAATYGAGGKELARDARPICVLARAADVCPSLRGDQ